ncbi:MAG: hypothetical protein QG608_1085, partial [Actinomycetota bacterium]|nr:hypothetical protein [Actinomycetota bacterium]
GYLLGWATPSQVVVCIVCSERKVTALSARFTQDYRPLYFLSALGAGGLSVSFFLYLMFLVDHPGRPVPTFDDLAAVYRTGTPVAVAGVTLTLTAITLFAARHVQLMVANIRAYRRFLHTPQYRDLRSSNAEVTLLAVPLALAMSVNVAFVLGALGVPGLWNAVEYLFPVALLAMTAIGAYALAVFGRYLGRILSHRGFDIDDTNHFSQALPSFAFAMVAVGFSSSAAMSTIRITSVIGVFGTFLFLTAALAWMAVKLPVSFSAMLRHGMAPEAGPTLWIGIPILTLFGIAFVRVASGISHNLLGTQLTPVLPFVVLGLLFATQLVMGLFGWTIMSRQGYFTRFVLGSERSIASYGLICPGVALSVLAMFFIHWGLIRTEVFDRFSPGHLVLLTAVGLVQAVTVAVLLRLDRKLLNGDRSGGGREDGGAEGPPVACSQLPGV